MRRTALLLAAVIVLQGLGCNRNVAPFDPDEQPRPPDLSRIFPVQDDAPSPGRAGPMGGGAPAPAATATASTGRPGAAVRGTVSLERGGVSGTGVLFVIARPAGAQGGPPLAVKRVPSPTFPYDFVIGPDDVMIPTMRFEGAITLSARLDADGNASTQGAEDRATRAPVSVAPGDAGVELRLE